MVQEGGHLTPMTLPWTTQGVFIPYQLITVFQLKVYQFPVVGMPLVKFLSPNISVVHYQEAKWTNVT